MKKTIIITLLSVALCAGIFMASAMAPKEPFRIHIIANSNSGADQAVKLKVRDAILNYTAGLDFKSMEQAESYSKSHISALEKLALEVLKKNGMDYGAKASVGICDFPDREYSGTVYPAGKYHALKVILGKGSGHNWWCVMFPPLCIIDTPSTPDETVEYTWGIGELIGSLQKK